MMAENYPQNQVRALVIIPGSVNYFYNQCGRRLKESLEEIDCQVVLTTLENAPQEIFDLCVFTNIHESIYAIGAEKTAHRRIKDLITRNRCVLAIAIDCVSTPWYGKTDKLAEKLGIKKVIDLGLCDQSSVLKPNERRRYRFLFSGLTPSEKLTVQNIPIDNIERPIPWAFIGHSTRFRIAVVDHLVQEVAPNGFVYMPAPAPYTEKGSPHLNQEQFENVLTKTQYQIWTSHHSHFYMEPERYRASLITGGVPIKITISRSQVPHGAPFQWTMPGIESISRTMTQNSFIEMRNEFVQEWLSYPCLAEELQLLLIELELRSGKASGWSLAKTMESRLVVDALEMAVSRRLPGEGLLLHSDRGSQYASNHYQQILKKQGIKCSMSGVGQCWDNAPMESFFASMKKGLVHHEKYVSRADAKASIIEYIEMFYNTKRFHSALGYVSPRRIRNDPITVN